MNLEEIKSDIKENYGIVRVLMDLHNLETGVNHFEILANEILLKKDTVYDLAPMIDAVEYLIKWSYTIGKVIDFRKGILLKGHTGRGKTFLFKVLEYFMKIDNLQYKENGKMKFIKFNIVNVKKIAGEYQSPTNGGYDVIEKYANYHCLVLDDIGKEQDESSNFGNKLNVVEEILNIRNDLNLLTFGTTNIDEMEDIYDDRTVSRMNALFNVFPINHKKDYRKL